MGLDTNLQQLRAAWDAVPDETKRPASELLGHLAVISAELWRVLGAHGGVLIGPGFATVLGAGTAMGLMGHDAAWLEGKIATHFPDAFAAIKAIVAPAPPAAEPPAAELPPVVEESQPPPADAP